MKQKEKLQKVTIKKVYKIKNKIQLNFSFILDITRKKSEVSSNEGDPIKKKLNEILSEGLLDSVLPYLIPNQSNATSRKSSTLKIGTGTYDFFSFILSSIINYITTT